ncbi:unnamed protein product, partial [Lampetra planeri]
NCRCALAPRDPIATSIGRPRGRGREEIASRAGDSEGVRKTPIRGTRSYSL